jgi:hypothetical protein
MVNKNRYSKIIDAVNPEWVTYFQNSNYITLIFTVRYNDKNEVDCLSKMEKRESPLGDFYVSDFNGDITDREFNEALIAALQFLTKRNYSVIVSGNL